MNRRRFSRAFLGALGASALSPRILFALSASSPINRSWGIESHARPRALPHAESPFAHTPALTRDLPRINAPRLHGWLRALGRFGPRPDGGVDRLAFTDADIQARAFVASLMEEAGLEVRVDESGNLLARRPGRESLPPLMLGSHIDSVPAGGNYDGPLGTLGALEVATTLAESGVATRHPLEVVVFVNEEGGKTGSRIMAGEFRPEELELVAAAGCTIREGILRLGGNPEMLHRARREAGSTTGFLELHVEQGGLLEAEEIPIGVVEGIVGIRRWNATVRGEANHAGTTPMDQRKDALLAAAELVQAVNRAAASYPGSQVATVGRIQALPGAPNVIPGEVQLSVEIRDLSMEGIQEVFRRVRRGADVIEAAHGTPIVLEEFYESAAAPTDERFRRWVEEAAHGLGLAHRRMPSGAGHDAQAVAHFAPVGMIFIPSVGGISHHPDEYSRPEDVEAGVNVLLRTLLLADEGLS
jgi:beta-ureidopropionase / N-carbamoyl-L-amino-acid hydrolase